MLTDTDSCAEMAGMVAAGGQLAATCGLWGWLIVVVCITGNRDMSNSTVYLLKQFLQMSDKTRMITITLSSSHNANGITIYHSVLSSD